MRSWTEAENVKAKRFPGLKIEKEVDSQVEFKAKERDSDPVHRGGIVNGVMGSTCPTFSRL